MARRIIDSVTAFLHGQIYPEKDTPAFVYISATEMMTLKYRNAEYDSEAQLGDVDEHKATLETREYQDQCSVDQRKLSDDKSPPDNSKGKRNTPVVGVYVYSGSRIYQSCDSTDDIVKVYLHRIACSITIMVVSGLIVFGSVHRSCANICKELGTILGC